MTLQNDPIAQLPLQMDIYLLDQLMRQQLKQHYKILDAGCGNGRNIHWLIEHDYDIYGVDIDKLSIRSLKSKYPHLDGNFFESSVESMPFGDQYFDYIISSAVLHFAKNEDHFFRMMQEMLRVLKAGGILFIRMTTDTGISDKIISIGNGIYQLPDGSNRFLLTGNLLQSCFQAFQIIHYEPLKTVNVNDQRCMCVLVLKKLA